MPDRDGERGAGANRFFAASAIARRREPPGKKPVGERPRMAIGLRGMKGYGTSRRGPILGADHRPTAADGSYRKPARASQAQFAAPYRGLTTSGHQHPGDRSAAVDVAIGATVTAIPSLAAVNDEHCAARDLGAHAQDRSRGSADRNDRHRPGRSCGTRPIVPSTTTRGPAPPARGACPGLSRIRMIACISGSSCPAAWPRLAYSFFKPTGRDRRPDIGGPESLDRWSNA